MSVIRPDRLANNAEDERKRRSGSLPRREQRLLCLLDEPHDSGNERYARQSRRPRSVS